MVLTTVHQSQRREDQEQQEDLSYELHLLFDENEIDFDDRSFFHQDPIWLGSEGIRRFPLIVFWRLRDATSGEMAPFITLSAAADKREFLVRTKLRASTFHEVGVAPTLQAVSRAYS